mmetsp:Transcript_14094/g.21057  ORF Transcript_14094/g.21057 Transcript_14094/m.21057 type:complete len:200 (+) Transcript_14094:2430-3029(+)
MELSWRHNPKYRIPSPTRSCALTGEGLLFIFRAGAGLGTGTGGDAICMAARIAQYGSVAIGCNLMSSSKRKIHSSCPNESELLKCLRTVSKEILFEKVFLNLSFDLSRCEWLFEVFWFTLKLLVFLYWELNKLFNFSESYFIGLCLETLKPMRLRMFFVWLNLELSLLITNALNEILSFGLAKLSQKYVYGSDKIILKI